MKKVTKKFISTEIESVSFEMVEGQGVTKELPKSLVPLEKLNEVKASKIVKNKFPEEKHVIVTGLNYLEETYEMEQEDFIAYAQKVEG